MKTKYLPLIPFLALVLLLLSPISATQAATNLPWTASGVSVDTNGAVTSPTNFWPANSNSIALLIAAGSTASNFIGQLSPTNWNYGTNADTNTYLRGDGTWGTPDTGSGQTNWDWLGITNTPTTLAGYGITDGGSTGGVAAVLGTGHQITVTTDGETNTLSFPTNLAIPGVLGVGKTNSGSGLAVFGPLVIDGSEPGVTYGTNNLALGKIATQTTTWTGQVATNAVDGNTNTYANTSGDASAWWMVDLGESTPIAKIVLTKLPGNGQYPSNYVVQCCADSNFVSGVTTLVTATNNLDIVATFGAETFDLIVSRWVRVLCMVSAQVMLLTEVSIYAPGNSTSSSVSEFKGPVSLGTINGPIRIGNFTGILYASNGIVSVATNWRTNTVVSDVQFDETGHVTNIVTTNLVYLSQ